MDHQRRNHETDHSNLVKAQESDVKALKKLHQQELDTQSMELNATIKCRDKIISARDEVIGRLQTEVTALKQDLKSLNDDPQEEVNLDEKPSSVHDITVARLQKEHKQTHAALDQAQKALQDKVAKLARAKTAHYENLQRLSRLHQKELANLKSTFNSRIADRDQQITILSSDKKALQDKVDQFMKQGDENGVADTSLRMRYSKLLQSNQLVVQQHNDLVEASNVLKAQCRSTDKITTLEISRAIKSTYEAVVRWLEDKLSASQSLVKDLKMPTAQGVVSFDMINSFLIATCKEHRFGDIPGSCWEYVDIPYLTGMQNSLLASALPL